MGRSSDATEVTFPPFPAQDLEQRRIQDIISQVQVGFLDGPTYHPTDRQSDLKSRVYVTKGYKGDQQTEGPAYIIAAVIC